MELDLRHLIMLARRWWWLLLLIPLITAVSANQLFNRNESSVQQAYVASALLLINPVQSTGRLNYTAGTYSELLQTRSVLEPVISELALPFGVNRLQAMVAGEPVVDENGRSTELLRVRVVDSEPQRAADIANAVGRSFVTFIGAQARQLTGPSRDQLQETITTTTDQIAALENEVAALESAANSSDASVQEQIATYRLTANNLRQTLSQLLSDALTMDLEAAAAQSQVILVNEASVPTSPVNQASGINPTLPAALAGLILAGAIVLLMGYFDSSVKSGEVAAAVVDAPLLSTVPRLTRLRTGPGQLFVFSEPQSAASEAIRRLRTNIEFASAVQDVGTIAISSPGQGEGKSTVTANLAVTMAQAGLRVILIDADFRHPTQHSIFGVVNEGGLSTLLTHHELPWQTLAVDISSAPGLRLIPSGPLPPNPADLLGVGYLRTCLDEIGQSVDVVLIDTAPILDVADSLIIGANVDGMILVCRGNRTTRDQLRGAAAAVRQGDVSIIGVVVNRLLDAAQSYGYGSTNYGSRRIGSRDGSAFSPDQLAREAVTDPYAQNAHDVASRR